MIELIGMAAGGAATLVVVGDIVADGRPGNPLWRTAETLRVLSGFLVTHITRVRPGDTDQIDAWLREHAGTTKVGPDDRLFFETQLELARREIS